MQSLRFDGESDESFRQRADRAGRLGRLLVDGCLGNTCIQEFIADPSLPYSEESCRIAPTVRVEYEQAIAIGGIGECLQATRSKHWGNGPSILPLNSDDPVDPHRILYVYRENSVYNKRFMQRRRLKELLGKQYRHLVSKACYKRGTKERFLAELTVDERQAVERLLHLTPSEFRSAARGKIFYNTLPAANQGTLDLDMDEECKDKRPPVRETMQDFFGRERRSRKQVEQGQLWLEFSDPEE